MYNWASDQYSIIVYNIDWLITGFKINYLFVRHSPKKKLFHTLKYFGWNSGSIEVSGQL